MQHEHIAYQKQKISSPLIVSRIYNWHNKKQSNKNYANYISLKIYCQNDLMEIEVIRHKPL